MLASKPPHPSEDERIWHQNASMIRQLYQEEKKTLKEVKAIMENDRGFPVTRLCIWEVKLRQLGMRKHLKAKEWSLVYQHLRPRLQYEGKKELIKPTAILINGTEKPLNDCWKEFRRNKALNDRHHRGLLPPLPSGVVIRTPSPELLENTLRMQEIESSKSLVLQLSQTTVVVFQPLLGLYSPSEAELNNAVRHADSVYKLCLEGVPFTRLLERLPDTTQGGLQSPHTIRRLDQRQNDHFTSALNPWDKFISGSHVISWESQLAGIFAKLLPCPESTSPTGQELSLNFDSHHYLFMALYLLSNSHLCVFTEQDKQSLKSILEIGFGSASKRIFLALLRNRLPSIEAAWEQLLRVAGWLQNRGALRDLISIGMENDWLKESVRGHELLSLTAANHCADLVPTLLARGCRADSSIGLWQRQPAIVEALEIGDLDCARLLVEHCDVNREFEDILYKGLTNFTAFINFFDGTKPDYHHCLSLFLEKGADVDGKFETTLVRSDIRRYWMTASKHGLMRDWPFSILDFVFYFNRPVFPKLASFSKESSQFSRSRALWCLEKGVEVLRKHLQQEGLVFARPWIGFAGKTSNSADGPAPKNICLGVMLVEQILLSTWMPGRNACLTTMKGLLELGVDLTWLSTNEELTADLLCAIACLMISGDGFKQEHGSQMMQMLLHQGFQIRADALSVAVEYHGSAVLECLAMYCSDLKKHGAKALSDAVRYDNYEAIGLLLDRGVDPNSIVIDSDEKPNTILATAASQSTLAMMKYLVQRGANPRIGRQEGHPLGVLVDILEDSHDASDFFVKIQYIVEEHITITMPSCPSSYLLEICLNDCLQSELQERRRVFEYLLNKGAKLRPGSPLAEWINAGGGHYLVREMLDRGADPQAFTFETNYGRFDSDQPRKTPLQAAAGVGDYTLVCMLMERGADLNQPAVGRNGMTALQAVCAWDPIRPEERRRKERIIKLLLDKGADVNAADCDGHTSLMSAAELGDLSTALILLRHGAKVDAIWNEFMLKKQTALDLAAYSGRIDMVEFLLNANALSSSACLHGYHYDYAIQLAEGRGHLVVAELIRQHSAARNTGWVATHEQEADAMIPPGQENQLQAVQGDSQMLHSLADTRRYQSSYHVCAICHPDENEDDCSEFSSDTDDSEAASEASEESATGVETTGAGWARAFEEIEDESLLPEIGRQVSPGDNSDRAVNQNSGPCEAPPGPGGSSHQLEGQFWNLDEEQDYRQLVSRSLATDVFMGFSE